MARRFLTPVELPGDPVGADEAARKSYVDAGVATRAPSSHTHPVGDLTATGTRNATTFLRGDNTWGVPTGAVASVNGQTGTVSLTAANVGAQPADADLTTIAALAPADGVLLRRVAGAWAASTLTKADVGLGNVSNLAPADLGISTATQAALDGKQPLDADLTAIAGLTHSADAILQDVAGTWAARTPTQVKASLALDNVANTTDANKPISNATQTALNGKQPLDTDLTAIAALAPADGSLLQRVSGAWAGSSLATIKTGLALSKADVGLGNVSNLAPADLPISDATQAALDDKRDRAPTIVNLSTITSGTIPLVAGAGDVHRITVTGSTATLAAPTGTPADGEVINVEIWPGSSAVTLSVTGITLTGGIGPSSIAIAANKLWSGALRYRGTTSPATVTAGWRLLASSADN